MRIKFIARQHEALIKGLRLILIACLLISITGCSKSLVSPMDRLATLRPIFTPSGSGNATQEDPPSPTQIESTVAPVALQPDENTPVASMATPAVNTRISSTATPSANKNSTPTPPILYYTQAGDTLTALAARFGVEKAEISAPNGQIPQDSFIDPGQLLIIPHRLGEVSSTDKIIPDSEIVFSPSALDFDIAKYVKEKNGYLNASINEWHINGWNNGAEVVYRVAIENSINPRLLLTLLEYKSHWVTGQPANLAQTDFPIGLVDNNKKGLYLQLSWAVQQLNIGYYGWRSGRVTELTFTDKAHIRLSPDLNAGTVALLYLFAQIEDQPNWAGAMYGPESLPVLYEQMFGSPWVRAQSVEPLFPATLTQPTLEFPFKPGYPWSFTGGPHSAWGPDGARASLDFAPATTVHGCYKSDQWVTAMASGLVVRSETGVVIVDLDGDGHEQTGWDTMYLHIATEDRVPINTWVNQDDRIGHPSCEGGEATGTHVHIARKYNGEWILADGPIPFILSGWTVHAGADAYLGKLIKGDQVVTSSIYGDFYSVVTR
jgi:LasA protease